MFRTTISHSLRQRPISSLRTTQSLQSSVLQTSSWRLVYPYSRIGVVGKRTLFTAAKPTAGSRFRGFVVRVGLVVAVIYWYNTTTLFAHEAVERQPHISRAPPVAPVPEEHYPTIEEIAAANREKKGKKARLEAAAVENPEHVTSESVLVAPPQAKDAEELEEEAGQQGAFNEETGEINWDCPCLGGMAHGPCGDEFRAAFSCFVFSKEEPKGVDCIEKFKGMQDCFQKFPEIYGEPPSDDEDEAEIDRRLEELDAGPGDKLPPNSEKPDDVIPKPKDDAPPKKTTSSSTPSKPGPSQDPTPSEKPSSSLTPSSNPTPSSSGLSHSPPQDRGTEEYTHKEPTNLDPKPGRPTHPSPGEKGLGGFSHEGPVDTDAETTGLIRPAPSGGDVTGFGGHVAPGVKGVNDPNGPSF